MQQRAWTSRFTLSEVERERERQIPCDTTYMWNPKYNINERIYETKTDPQIQRTDL